MKENVSDFLLNRLAEWGVKRIFGYSGDGINGIMGASNRADDKIEFVQVRHEEMAAFMACAHAKFTGEVGVCLATSGPPRRDSFTEWTLWALSRTLHSDPQRTGNEVVSRETCFDDIWTMTTMILLNTPHINNNKLINKTEYIASV